MLNPLLFSLTGLGPSKEKTLSDLNSGTSDSSSTTKTSYDLGNSGYSQPEDSDKYSMENQYFAAGGLAEDPTGSDKYSMEAEGKKSLETPLYERNFDYRKINQEIPILNPLLFSFAGFAEGGLATNKHPAGEPQFYSQGGLGNMYVHGDGDGTSDSVPAMLAKNEFVIPADVVSALGNGSSEAGADVLEKFMYEIRDHKQAHNPRDLPPQSKGPLEYLSAAMKKGK